MQLLRSFFKKAAEKPAFTQLLRNAFNFGKGRPLVKCIPINYFSYFSTKTYVEGTQKNHLNETVPLSTENIC